MELFGGSRAMSPAAVNALARLSTGFLEDNGYTVTPPVEAEQQVVQE